VTNNKIYRFAEEYLTIVSEMNDELSCYCPFHENTDSPAFSINKRTGLWQCFNANCGQKGRFATLVKRITGHDNVVISDDFTVDKLEEMLFVEETNKPEGYEEAMERITINYRDQSEVAKLQYLIDRGFQPAILEHFEVGYSSAQNRVVIPVRDEDFKVVGFIGRSVDGTLPKYKYTDKFPRRNILLNLCNAKQYDMGIVVEGSLDHIAVHQAGFPNVVSTMGSTVSPPQIDLLNKYFSSLIIFSDNDEAGEKMKCAIMEGAAKKEMFVVTYPEGLKDPGEMSSQQIQTSIQTRTTHLEYLFHKL